MKINITILSALVLIISVVLYAIISVEIVINNAQKTIRTNENVSDETHIDVWIVEHEWKSNWYVIGYMFRKCDCVCSDQEKEGTPWKCNDDRCDTILEYVWFNTQTKETHDAWSEMF